VKIVADAHVWSMDHRCRLRQKQRRDKFCAFRHYEAPPDAYAAGALSEKGGDMYAGQSAVRGSRGYAQSAGRLASRAGVIAASGMLLTGGLAWGQGGLDEPIDPGSEPIRGLVEPNEGDRMPFTIGTINLTYDQRVAGLASLPSIDELNDLPVVLLQTSQGFVAPREGLPRVTLTIGQINSGPDRVFYTSAIEVIGRTVSNELRRRGFIGLYITPEEIDLVQGLDIRGPGDTAVTMPIRVAFVTGVYSSALGDRIPAQRQRIPSGAGDEFRGLPEHERIREKSPVTEANVERFIDETGVPQEEVLEITDESLLRRDRLDEYVLFLNRHPGRQVDVALSPGLTTGSAALYYNITESKPWSVFYQLSNTGTENTNEYRHRFGFLHNQLFGFDDILQVDYITAGFDETHALIASYEAPLWDPRVRGRIFGNWNQFEASDVGFAGEEFKGNGWSVGAELSYNIFQRREFFVDVYGGFRYQHVEIENTRTGVDGEADLFFPMIGARVERVTEASALTASINLEIGLGENERNLQALGRVRPDADFPVLTWDVRFNQYLEPLLFGDDWFDPSTPETSTLAHEIYLRFSGQNSLGSRLAPNFQAVSGGLYSVRGYDESVVASDNQYLFTAEYRFHLPRVLPFQPEPKTVFGRPFKVAPQGPYRRPDWDLILRGFADIGFTNNQSALSFEDSETLIGAGVGVELQIKRNLNVRLDWGFVLNDAGDNESGDNRLHFVMTLLY